MAATSSAEPGLDSAARKLLLGVARQAVARGLDGEHWMPSEGEFPEALRRPRACFVTLHCDARLRGCVGTLRVRLPLVSETARSAHAAAFDDPRFPALSREELAGLDYHISVLAPAEALTVGCEQDLLALLRPGVDGLILRDGRYSGTFLPDVWSTLPDPVQFLRHLRLKAGLAADHWSPTMEFARYTTESFGDHD